MGFFDLMGVMLMGNGFGNKLGTNMNMLCAKASTIEEQIRKAELSGRKKRKRDVDDWLAQVDKIMKEFITLEDEIQEKGFLGHFFGGGEVAKLDSKIHSLLQKSQHFGELVHDNKIGSMLLTAGFVGKQFQTNLENIFNWLMMDDMPSIGIYGMGGIGKTTLVKYINNWILEQTQRCVVWVTVTQEYTISMLQDCIAEALAVDLSDEYNEGKRALRLHRALSIRNNTLLILDDVWNYINLEKLGDPLSIDGCGLMITSRSKKLCNQIGCRKLVEVKRLQVDDAWKLFRRTLGQDAELTWQVENIAKTMARLCDGLPLGVVTLARAMRGESAIHVWRDTLAAMRGSLMGQQDMEEQVFKVLKLSFDRLNRSGVKKNSYSKTQLCFLYCSLYPENCNMEREELIRKFIVEGLLEKRDSREAMFDQGHTILDKLVTCCLLEETHDQVKMHDLVRAMALKLTDGKYMVITGNGSLKKIPTGEEWNRNLEKASLSFNSIKEIPPGLSPNCPKLSTLLFNNNPLQFIPDAFFLQIPGLSILDLSRTDIMKLPHTISDLVCLKALFLKECQKLEYVPALGKLKELSELDFTHTVIKELPQGMEELENLSFLSLDKIYKLKMLPRGFLLKFQYLQCLYLPYHLHVPGEEVAGLKHLEEFRGGVKDANNLFMLIKSNNRLAYSIEVGSDFPCYRVDGFRGYNQLLLSSYDFKAAGEENMGLLKQSGFRHLQLYSCEGHSSCIVEDLARMSHPSLLDSLELYGCEVTEYLFREEQFVVPNNGATIIRSTTISPPAHPVFSSLKRLEIFHCNKLKSLGLFVSEILNLESLTIAYCKEIGDIMKAEKRIGTWESEGENVVSLPKLKCLFLEDLPKLKSFCDAKVVCNSIETISLWGCPALIEFPLVYDQSNSDYSSCSLLDSSSKRGRDGSADVRIRTSQQP